MNNIIFASFILRGYRSGTKDVSLIFGHYAASCSSRINRLWRKV